MEEICNYDCRHAGCQGYAECQFKAEQKRRDDMYFRFRLGEDSLRALGTDPLTALEGDLLDW
jgi:hypothetical protein